MDNRIATLSFDDGGWQDEYVINALDKAGVPGTFYVCSEWITRHHYRMQESEIVDLFSKHEIGCHSATHIDMGDWTTHPRWDYELAGARAKLIGIFNQPVLCFCYPFGNYTPRGLDCGGKSDVDAALKRAGFKWARTINFGNLSELDVSDPYCQPATCPIQHYLLKKEWNGEPLHFTSHSWQMRDQRSDMLITELIKTCLDQGYKFVTNSDFFTKTVVSNNNV